MLPCSSWYFSRLNSSVTTSFYISIFFIIAIVENYCSADFVLLGLLFAGQKYDEAKEAQALLEKKQKQLNRVESLKLAEDAAGQ